MRHLGPRRPRRSPRLAELAPEHSFRKLELKVTRRLDGLLQGEHQGLLPGPGSDFAEARLYQPGEDDVRHMDWAVTARTTTPHVRDQIADHELEAWALVDLSPSMDFGTARLEKRDLAVASLAAVGFLTTRLGDRFGAYVLHRGQVRRWPARTGRAAMYGLLQSIVDSSRTPAGEAADSTLAEGVHGLARSRIKRGLRVVISDFLEPAAAGTRQRAWERPMRQLAARHQVLAIEIVDPRELELPGIGVVTLTDPETGEAREVNLSPGLRQRYAEAAAEQREATREALRRCGVPHLVLRTDRDWVHDIARFALRHRRMAGRLHAQKVGGRA